MRKQHVTLEGPLTRAERRAIEAALQEPDVRAFLIVVGMLKPFSDSQRRRMLGFVADSLNDPTRPTPAARGGA